MCEAMLPDEHMHYTVCLLWAPQQRLSCKVYFITSVSIQAAGPDNIPGCALKTRASQLADGITDIFNISLSQESSYLLPATTSPVPKKSAVSSLNEYHPVAPTATLMKCFEKLVLQCIKDNVPAILGCFAFKTSRSTEDVIFTALHSLLKITTPTSECCLLVSA